MKALIVIELPDEHFLKTTNDLYDRLKGYKCELMPMPSKMKVDYDTISSAEVTDKVVAIGWNACLEEIENGTDR